jgi:peptidoglycan/xylan/chitin deacetylase (PgdA/CDA1 family)
MTINLDRRTFLIGAGALLALPLIGQASTLFPQTQNKDTAVAKARGRVPVLLYHDISDYLSDAYTVTATQFASQMEWLYNNGYQAISLKQISDLAIPTKTIVITFDDGYASFMDFAFPLLRYYNFKATINIIGEYVGSYLSVAGNRPMLSWDEYRYLTASGVVDLGCHTYKLHAFRHRGVADVSEKTLHEDIQLFQKTMVREIGKPSEIMAWPYGFYTKRTIEIAAQAGIRYMLTSQRGFLGSKSPMTEIPRIPVGNDMDFKTFKSILDRNYSLTSSL